jgi:hypothetical protein
VWWKNWPRGPHPNCRRPFFVEVCGTVGMYFHMARLVLEGDEYDTVERRSTPSTFYNGWTNPRPNLKKLPRDNDYERNSIVVTSASATTAYTNTEYMTTLVLVIALQLGFVTPMVHLGSGSAFLAGVLLLRTKAHWYARHTCKPPPHCHPSCE